jgi:hypothetical protein
MYDVTDLVVDNQTLWDQIELLAEHLDISYQALLGETFASPLIHADKTYWQMLSKGSGKKWYVWTVASRSTVMKRIFPSRSTATAREVLGDYHGSVVADGYEPYQTVARGGLDGVPRYTLAFCMAHVRRNFVEAEASAPAYRVSGEPVGRARQQLGGATTQAAGCGPEESLRQQVEAWDRGSRDLLLGNRDGSAVGRRSVGIPAAGSESRDRRARNGQAATLG